MAQNLAKQRLRNPPEGGTLIAVIGDEDTVTGFLLAGVGNVDVRKNSNFLIVDNKTPVTQIEDAFHRFTQRTDVSILLINQHIANKIRHLVDQYVTPIPALLEIPSKEFPYDPSQDSILQRVKQLCGVASD
eukprot:TRINITY_DN4978_c0_g1::TRINITY_DN4978_c0_g1_i1::g.16685::m.16685 TRINITY_DN4978_c0_g1::TRINITY_DN4978_c0_g1_i1::g.16685  ORF type:complete len:131 (-),score=42.04,sp/Q9ZQX4/VATF_ARATH/60.68/9e-48,ATP-synt_F/PF01990.12/7.8e-31,DXP_synthase_N/PF13292.1/0.087 TRINITY_DN4978_c0_g1_i1:688-1080(-)